VTLNVEVPLLLSGDIEYEWSTAVISGTNTGRGQGVYGSGGSNGAGVSGYNDYSNAWGYLASATYGVRGIYDTPWGNIGMLGSSDWGVYGIHQGSGNYGLLGDNNYGVFGCSESNYGVRATSTSNYALYATSTSSTAVRAVRTGGGDWAGRFGGNVEVTGTLSKGGGSFKIDHPLDPENKYLCHSFVESPDMMNIYNGNIALDKNGEAWVELPVWFESLNNDFRYQLTAIGAPGPNLYISQKIVQNRFKIAGGSAGMEVSWQVTGVRHDPFAETHRIVVEVEKTGQERGKYLYAREYGMPENMAVDYEEIQKLEEEMKTMGNRQRIEQEKIKAENERFKSLQEQHK
jgi:hypothetical protein